MRAAQQQSYAEQNHAVVTWRYLRVAMVVLVVGLGVSIVLESVTEVDPNCFLNSISGYYWTPVHGYFVGALVSIGVCLFCLKGNTAPEDILLNLAGMLAPVVAFVPTPDNGSCSNVPRVIENSEAAIVNNVWALLAVGAFGLAVLAVLAVVRRPTKSEVVGFVVAVALLVAAFAVFQSDRDYFIENAHDAAAFSMFFFIFLAVASNARRLRLSGDAQAFAWGYVAIAALMAVSFVVLFFVIRGPDRVIRVEFAQIVLFAVFWAVQTWELWDEGLRPTETGAAARTAAADART
jgi:hypothetical protein